MTDQPDWPGWTPPGGQRPDDEPAPRPSGGDEGAAHRGDAESTDQIPVPDREPGSEPTQQLPTDPPPPPPPPAAAQPPGWGPPPPPGGQPAYGTGGWQPPPPRRRTGLIVGIVAAVVLVAMVFGLGAVLVARSASTTGSGPVLQDEPRVEEPEAPGGRATEVPSDDLEAQSRAVLETINASEERMLAFQEVVFSEIGEDGTVGDGAAAIAREAQEAGDDLTQMRSDLRALAGGQQDEFDGLRDIRDTYGEHMNAWIDYLDEVAGSPALASPDSPDAAPLWREIEVTGDDFVSAVESGLPDGLPAELEDLAEFIVERGFGGFDDGSTGDVV